MKLRYFLLTNLISFAAVAAPFPQTYRIDWYQATDAACPVEADAIGRKFEAVTGHPVIGTSCQRPFSWKQDVVIQYDASAPARLVTTYAETGLAQGTFATKAACESGLAAEVELFENETNLSAVTAFCFPESSFKEDNHYPFIARIDGFGTPRLRPFVFSGRLYDLPSEAPQVFESNVAVLLANNQKVVSPRMRVDYARNGGRLAVKYYAKRKLPLVLESFVSYESSDSCKKRRGSVDDFLRSFGVDSLTSFCGNEQFSTRSSHYYFGSTTGFYSVETGTERYQTMALCEGDLTALEEAVAQLSGSPHVAAVCSYERPTLIANPTFLAKVFVAR